MPAPPPTLKAKTLAPYFVFAALVHAGAIATRFDLLAAKLPPSAPLAIMLAQFPLLYLTGFFESRIDHGESPKGFPLWMKIDSKAVMAAVTFGCMYLVIVAAQRWDVSIGPIDPTPPLEFPAQMRAMWFAMFTLGASMIFFMAAAGIVIPILRFLTYPLRYLPIAAAAVLALVIGGGLGLVIMSAMQSTKIAASIEAAKAAMYESPGLFVGVICAVTLGPLFLGLFLKSKDD